MPQAGRTRILAALLLAAPLAPEPAAAPQRLNAPWLRTPPEDEPEAKEFTSWVAALARGKRRLSEEREGAPRARVADFARWAQADAARELLAAEALLDLYALCLAAEAQATEPLPQLQQPFGVPPLPPGPPAPELALGEAVLDALRPLVREGGGAIARQVLALRSQPLERRVAAAWALARARPSGAALALAATLVGAEPALLCGALPALEGWADPRIDALFERLWEQPPGAERAGERARVLGLVEAHFAARTRAPDAQPLAPEQVERLAAEAARRMGGADWREASRAVAIARALPDEAIVPSLIEALGLWTERHLAGEQARRVQAELARELERRSGRSIGLHAEGWRQWWRAVREGRISADPAAQPAARTVASFFGLRPSSDRLVFVLDRSGSMDWAFGAYSGTAERPGRTRYEEACEQLLGYLRASGPRTRFGVILFESRSENWSRELRPAKEEVLAELESWLRVHRPGGGTELRPAVERAVDAQASFAGLEADTLIVLCDGETAEGASWAGAFARRLHDLARVAIHCVQVGGSGDGTLERLARETGGEFVRVPG